MFRNRCSAGPLLRQLRSICAGAALATIATTASPQTFLGSVPPQPFTLPDPHAAVEPPRVTVLPTPQPAEPTRIPKQAIAPVAAAPVDSQSSLRRLASTLRGFRLSGETAALEWPVFLTPAQANDHFKIRIAYLTAVSDAPELSTLTVSLNDTKIGEVNLEAPSATRTFDIEVPPQIARYGYNSLRLTAKQRHRVDCSVDATYELWTQIDASQTGLVFSPNILGVDDVRYLAAVSPAAGGAMPIRVVVTSRVTPTQMRRLFRALQAVSLAAQVQQPLVDFGAPASGASGLNLIVGTQDELARQQLGESLFAGAAKTSVRPATAGRRTTVILTGLNEKDLDAGIAQLAASIGDPAEGSPSGLRAHRSAPGLRVYGGERIKLGDLGLMSQEFSGRFFRVGFDIVMPADFLPADYAKAMLDLAGGYAAGLAPGAQILVHINEKSVASVRLPKSSGDVFKQNQIALPLGFWQPGVNHIEILVQLPVAADAVCDTLSAGINTKRFLFLDSSMLTIPNFARVGHVPELAATFGGGLPYTDHTCPSCSFLCPTATPWRRPLRSQRGWRSLPVK